MHLMVLGTYGLLFSVHKLSCKIITCPVKIRNIIPENPSQSKYSIRVLRSTESFYLQFTKCVCLWVLCCVGQMKKNIWNKVITAGLWGGVFIYLLVLTKPSVGRTLWRTKWERLKCYDKIKERSYWSLQFSLFLFLRMVRWQTFGPQSSSDCSNAAERCFPTIINPKEEDNRKIALNST